MNRVYQNLTEQLSTEEMNDLGEQQRARIVYRDDTAKDLSIEAVDETEELEYGATQANLTHERCYLLVMQYME